MQKQQTQHKHCCSSYDYSTHDVFIKDVFKTTNQLSPGIFPIFLAYIFARISVFFFYLTSQFRISKSGRDFSLLIIEGFFLMWCCCM